MPLQKRLPKFGFSSRVGRSSASIRLAELNKVSGDTADLDALRKAGLVTTNITRARVFLSGELKRPVVVKGLGVTKGARAAIEAAGGSVEE
jgi:large subunit ribosomal protein L15